MNTALTVAAAITALAGCLSPAAFAAGAADQVTVVDPYVRLVPKGAMATAAYMGLKNAGAGDVKVVGAENNASKITELHTHLVENGMMKMRKVPDIAVKAQGETTLEPGGLHIMMIDLNAPLQEGGKVALTLKFDDGSSKTVDAVVRKPMPMPAMDHSKHMQR